MQWNDTQTTCPFTFRIPSVTALFTQLVFKIQNFCCCCVRWCHFKEVQWAKSVENSSIQTDHLDREEEGCVKEIFMDIFRLTLQSDIYWKWPQLLFPKKEESSNY